MNAIQSWLVLDISLSIVGEAVRGVRDHTLS